MVSPMGLEVVDVFEGYFINESSYYTEDTTTFSVLNNHSEDYTNNSNYFGENGTMLKHSTGWTIAIICAYVTIFIVGTVGNVMVVCVLVFRPQMKTVTNMFILNLAGKFPYYITLVLLYILITFLYSRRFICYHILRGPDTSHQHFDT